MLILTEATHIHRIVNEYFPDKMFETHFGNNKIDLTVYPRINYSKNDKLNPLLFVEAKNKPTDLNVMFAQLTFCNL